MKDNDVLGPECFETASKYTLWILRPYLISDGPVEFGILSRMLQSVLRYNVVEYCVFFFVSVFSPFFLTSLGGEGFVQSFQMVCYGILCVHLRDVVWKS